MATAIMLKGPELSANEGKIRVDMSCFFLDSSLGVADPLSVSFDISEGDTPLQIETAIVDAIMEQKKIFYPTMNLPRSNCLFFDIKRGK